MLHWFEQLPSKLQGYENILLITSPGLRKRGELQKAFSELREKNLIVIEEISPLPTIDSIQRVFDSVNLKNIKIQAILAVGGGSVIDSAKCILALFSVDNRLSLRTLLESDVERLIHNPIPLIAVPTTAGTGSEVTSFATVWDSDFKVKKSLESRKIKPTDFILDHNFLTSLNYENYLYPLLDAISHSLESIWNVNASTKSLPISFKALDLLTNVITKPFEELKEDDLINLTLGSNLAGEAIEITRTAIAHSISYPLTAHYLVPHGLSASFTLPKLIDFYITNIKTDLSYVNLLKFASQSISNLNLHKLLYEYCTKDQILNLIPEMLNPSRFDKFMFNISAKDLNYFLD